MAYVNHGGSQYGEVNCALCTVAAICGTNTRTLSGLLGLNGHQPEESFAIAYMKKHGITRRVEGGEELGYNLEGIKEFVDALKKHVKSPVHVSQGGSWETLVPLDVQVRFMGGYPVGTQFAVWACLSGLKGLGAHWNYAERTSTGVEFRDYQYNDADDHPPRTSEAFIPPKGNEDETYTRGIVLVFHSQSTPLF